MGIFATALNIKKLVSSPASPDAGEIKLYPKGDDRLYTKTSTGVEKGVSQDGHGHALTDSSITGIIPDSQLPVRLGPSANANSVTNPDTATSNGWYYWSGAGNSLPETTGAATPDVGLQVVAHSASWVAQTARDWRTNGTWTRNRLNGAWGRWLKVSTSRHEQGGHWTYKNPFSWYSGTAAGIPATSALAIVTNLEFTSPNVIGKITIGGLNTADNIEGRFSLYLYSATGGTIYQPSWITEGLRQVDLRFAKTAANKLVIILKPTVSIAYARVKVTELSGSLGEPTQAAMDGWAASVLTEAEIDTAYSTTIVNPTITRHVIQELDGKAPTIHGHAFTDANMTGVVPIAQLPTPASGNASTAQVVRGNDPRLTDSRTPTAHGHALTDANMTGILPIAQVPTGTTSTTVALGNHTHTPAQIGAAPAVHGHALTDANITGILPIAQLPVAASGVSSSTSVVRADDSRLSNARTPTTHTHTLAQLTAGILAVPLQMANQTAPATPSAGSNTIYFKADGHLYRKDSSGIERPITSDTLSLHANPTFDVESGGEPADWSDFWMSGGATLSLESVDKVGGMYAAKITKPASADGRITTNQFSVQGGATVTFRFYSKSNVASTNMEISMLTNDSAVGGAEYFTTGVSVTARNLVIGTSYNLYETSFSVPGSHNVGKLVIRPSDSAARTVLIDETSSSMTMPVENPTPTGAMLMWPTLLPPAGFLVCDGAIYNVADYPILGAVLGSTWGGNGTTTFAVPDFVRRFPMGVGSGVALGASDGQAAASRTSNHKHDKGTLSTSGTSLNQSLTAQTGGSAARLTTPDPHSHSVTGVTGNMDSPFPHLGINFIIKT